MSDKLAHKLSPNRLLALLLAVWWLLNVLQAAFTELANDEAYYWFFSWKLDWGYYDHPPMVALLVWLTSWIPDELGVRLACTLLQPLYLYLFWTLIRPAVPTRRDAWTYALICFSIPMLQLYGFLALPDAPLLFFTVVFLWAFRRFSEKDSIANTVLLAVSMALLVYSKYNGVLVILFVIAANFRLFRSWKFYLSGLLALLLFMPHLWWQYVHDFATFQYHLVGRATDAGFDMGNVTQFLLNLLVVFNPLWIWLYGKWVVSRGTSEGENFDIRRTLRFVLIGTVVFFFLSSLRDSTQPQWLLPIVFALVVALFDAVRHNERYIRVVSVVFLGLFLLVRVVVMANPFHLKGEFWNNKADNQAIAELADGHPVLFTHNYTASAKYTFYTGQPAYTQALLYDRTSQWKYSDLDEGFIGQEVLVCVRENKLADTLILPSGSRFEYVWMPNYRPLKKVHIVADSISTRLTSADTIWMNLHVTNPYSYDLCSSEETPMQLTFIYRITQHKQPETDIPLTDTLKAHSTTDVLLPIPVKRMPETGSYRCGYSLRYKQFRSCLSSDHMQLQAQRDTDSIFITLLP